MKALCDVWYLSYSNSAKLILSDIPLCTSIMHPNCENGLLLHISKFYVWLFDIDDKIEQHMKRNDVAWVWAYLDRLDETLETMECPGSFAEGRVFITLWEEMKPCLQERVGNDLIREIRAFFRLEKEIQANYRMNGKPVAFDRYLDYRKTDSIIMSCCLLVEYAQQIAISDALYHCDDMETLHELSCFVLIVANDIGSFNFEYRRGEIMNYIISMQAHTGWPLRKCIDQTYEDAKEAMDKLREHFQMMKAEYASDRAMRTYLDNLEIMQDGYMRWHELSSRYISPDGKTRY